MLPEVIEYTLADAGLLPARPAPTPEEPGEAPRSGGERGDEPDEVPSSRR